MKRTLSLLVAVLMVVGLASALAIGSAATEYQLPTQYGDRTLDWSVVDEDTAKPTYEDRELNWLQVIINLYWGWEDLQTDTSGGGTWMQSGEYFVSLDFGEAPAEGIDSESPYEVKVAGDAIIAGLSEDVKADETVADAIGYYNFLAEEIHGIAAGVHNDSESYYIFDVLDDLLRDAVKAVEDAAAALVPPEPATLPQFLLDYINTPFDFNEYVQTEAEMINGGPFDLTTEDGYQIYLETVQAVADDYNATRGAAITQVAVYREIRASLITEDIMDNPDVVTFLSYLDQLEDIITGDTLYTYNLYTMPLTGNSFDSTLQSQWNLFRTKYGFDGRIKTRDKNGDEYEEKSKPDYIIMHPELYTAASWEAFCKAYAKAVIAIQWPHVGADGKVDSILETEASSVGQGYYTYATSQEIWDAMDKLVLLADADGESASTKNWSEIQAEVQAAYVPRDDMPAVGDVYYEVTAAEFTPADPEYPDDPDNPDDPGNPDNPDNPDDPANPDNPDDPNNPDNPDDPQSPGTFDVSMVSGLVALASAASAAFVGLKKKR